jgi:hypothetical protein
MTATLDFFARRNFDMVRWALFLSLLLPAAAILAACGDSDGPGDPGLCFIDEGRFRDLGVSAGTTPLFTWCGAPAMILLVRSVPARQNVVWRVTCTDTSFPCIAPGVRYGVVPVETNQTVAPVTLQAGASYELCLLLGADDETPTCLEFSP